MGNTISAVEKDASWLCEQAVNAVSLGKAPPAAIKDEDKELPLGKKETSSVNKPDPSMHWLPHVPRKGVLGPLLKRVNHYAITVNDVGKSLDFYVNVLGLQQIRRPNFDRHGAWLTAGNLEIHLIKGPPSVPQTDSLIVSHLSFESDDIMECQRRLKASNCSFTQNVSVPNKNQTTIVTQFFMKDPDGYHIEICNCDILTKFCLSQDEDAKMEYSETTVSVTLFECLQLLKKAAWARDLRKQRVGEKAEDLVLAPRLQAPEADENKLRNLLARTKIWGDVTQGETEATLTAALKEANNNVPLATRIIRARKGGVHSYHPPAVFKEGIDHYQPEAIVFSAPKAVQEATGFDRELIENPHARYRVLFDMIDEDRSGGITLAEAEGVLLKFSGGQPFDTIAEMFQEFGEGDEAEITFPQFVELCEKQQQHHSAQVWEDVFDLCDDDGNGTMQAPELCHKLADLGMVMSDEEMDEIFIEADENGDGVLSKEEFAAFMTDLHVKPSKSIVFAPGVNEEKMQELFEEADEHGDGVLTKEFIAFMADKTPTTRGSPGHPLKSGRRRSVEDVICDLQERRPSLQHLNPETMLNYSLAATVPVLNA